MKPTRILMSALAIATAIVAARCAPVQSQSRRTDAENAVVGASSPVLESVLPDSVVLPSGGTARVTLTGTGFIPGEPGRNTVHFNGAVFRSVSASSDGRQIVFDIPDVISRGGGAPPSTLSAGSYDVSVETTGGTSNAVAVRVYR
jgi:hypothetical protein